MSDVYKFSIDATLDDPDCISVPPSQYKYPSEKIEAMKAELETYNRIVNGLGNISSSYRYTIYQRLYAAFNTDGNVWPSSTTTNAERALNDLIDKLSKAIEYIGELAKDKSVVSITDLEDRAEDLKKKVLHYKGLLDDHLANEPIAYCMQIGEQEGYFNGPNGRVYRADKDPEGRIIAYIRIDPATGEDWKPSEE